MKKTITKSNVLIGVWRSTDPLGSDVEYRVTKKKTAFTITARDTSDDERADIFEEKWNLRTEVLSFSTYWASTGRFSRCRLRVISEGNAELTYTHTDTETLARR